MARARGTTSETEVIVAMIAVLVLVLSFIAGVGFGERLARADMNGRAAAEQEIGR